jgi:hypothetical protein
MELEKRRELTAALRELTGQVAADIREQVMKCPSAARERAEALHRDEKVGEDFTVWTDLLARRAAVLWVLKTVYVRVLEDRGLLRPVRLAERELNEVESRTLFEHLAPNLGPTAYLKWVFRDLAQAAGGLPELFTPQPAEVALPSDASSKGLLDLGADLPERATPGVNSRG